MLDLRRPQPQPWPTPGALLRSDAGVLLLLGCLTALTFIRVLWADFLSYDDPFYVTNNPLVLNGLSWSSFASAWTSFDCANWHPGTWISLMLDYQLFGLHPWGFHLTNLLLHVANTLLLYTFLRRLRLERGPSLFVAAVFGVHPLHVESVAWITERKDVLATLFGLLSMLAYVKGVYTGEAWRRYASCGWFALSLTAKPLLVTLPCVLLLLDYWPLGRWSPASDASKSSDFGSNTIVATTWRFLGLVAEKWLFWILTLGSSIVTIIAQHQGGAVASLEKISLLQRLANICVSYGTYLQKSFWPTRLAAFYPYSMNHWEPLWVVLFAILLLIITGLAWRLRQRDGSILLGWLWFLGTMVPMIGLIQVGGQALADRYMYFPLIGLTWAAMSAVRACWPASPRRSQYQCVAGVGLVAVMCVMTWQQTGYWRNTLLLSQHALEVTPDNHIALDLHARALRIAGMEDLALAEYRRALEINPQYTAAHNDLGAMLLKRGELDAAVAQFRLGLQTAPRHLRLRWNLAHALTRQEQFAAALTEFNRAQLDAPTNDVLCLDHARTLVLAGQHQAAIDMFEHAVELSPQSLTNRLELALALSRAPENQGRDLSRSIQLLQKLAALTDAPRVWIALAEVQTAAGQTAAADATWKRAKQRALSLKRPDLQDLVKAAQQRAPH
ncbi:MAG: tetratricopeptide repeat protein [Planctomycetota bacterium]